MCIAMSGGVSFIPVKLNVPAVQFDALSMTRSLPDARTKGNRSASTKEAYRVYTS